MILGAVVAIGVGPWGALLLGTAGVTAAITLLVVAPPSTFATPAIGLLSISEGMVRPALWAAAVVAFARPHEASRLGLVLLMWVSMNLAGIAARVGFDQFMPLRGSPAFAWVSLVAALLAAVLSLLLLMSVLASRPAASTREREPTLRWDPGVFAVTGLWVLLLLGPWAAITTAYGALDDSLRILSPAPLAYEGWSYVNPSLVIWLGGMAAAGAVLLAMSRRNVSSGRLIGVGLILIAAGLGACCFEGVRREGLLLGAAMAVWAAGEVLVGPVLISRIGADLHWRAVTPMIALFLGGEVVLHRWWAPFGVERLPSEAFLPGGFGAAAGAVLGVLLLIGGGWLQRRLYTPDVPAAGARPAVPI